MAGRGVFHSVAQPHRRGARAGSRRPSADLSCTVFAKARGLQNVPHAVAFLKSRRAADALPPLMRAVALEAELYDREHSPELSDAQIAPANCYLILGQSDQALVLLASAEKIQASHRELGRNIRSRSRAAGPDCKLARRPRRTGSRQVSWVKILPVGGIEARVASRETI
jgi:hypothetical protein